MRNVILTVVAVALVIGLAGNVMAADGNLSSGMLADMGLAGVTVMADTEGEKIRGKGFVIAGGFSWASIGDLSKSANGALAVSHTFGARAGQQNGSRAAGGFIDGRSMWATSGGFSAGYAK